jgi:hypothetical protein
MLIITAWIRHFTCHHHILQSTAAVAMVRCHNTLQHFFSNSLNTFLISRLLGHQSDKMYFVYLTSDVAPKEAARCYRNTRRYLNKENQLDRWTTPIAARLHVHWCLEQCSYSTNFHENSQHNATRRPVYRVMDVNWPMHSCDLAVPDYFSWGYTESKVHETRPVNLDLKTDNFECIQRVAKEILRVMTLFPPRLQKWNEIHSDHLQSVMFKQ